MKFPSSFYIRAQFDTSEELLRVLGVVDDIVKHNYSLAKRVGQKPRTEFQLLDVYRRETTLVQKDVVLTHVAQVAAKTSAIRCVFRSAMLLEDRPAGFFIRLMPDEGFSAIVKLREALSTGVLETYLDEEYYKRMPQFIPSYNIFWVATREEGQAAVRKINSLNFEIVAFVDTLVVFELALSGGKKSFDIIQSYDLLK